MDQITEALDRLSELNDGEIADLEGRILTSFGQVEKESPTPETVNQMTGLADALDAVRGETTRRTEQAKELSRLATEAASRVYGDPSTVSTPTAEPLATKDDEDNVASDAAPAPGEAPAPDSAPAEEAPAEPVGEPDVAPDEEAPVETDPVADDEEDEDGKKKSKPAFSADTTEAVATDASSPSTSPGTELAVEETTPIKEPEGAVTASAPSTGGQVMVTPPAENRPIPTKPTEGVTLAITAGADIPGVGSGSTLTDMDAVAKAFANRLHTLRNVQGGIGEQHTIATLAFDYPEDRRLTGDDQRNIALVERISGVEAITAAAGICAPLETLYDINICGVSDRPVRDSLARFSADRGGVRIYPPPTLTPPIAGIWDPMAPTAKTCIDAGCSTPTDTILKAVYACMTFSNFTGRFFPEIVKANTDLALIYHARFAEQNLLNGIEEQSVNVTVDSSDNVGLTRAIIVAIRQAAVGIRRRHRLAVDSAIRTILPSWVFDAMVADLAKQMPGDGLEALSVSESRLRAIFADANVNVTWALDEVGDDGAPVNAPAQAAGELVGFPDTINYPVFPEGAFLYLDGGTLDLGVVRDMSTITQNQYATFVESFENVVLTGCESLWVTQSGLCVSGAAAGLVDTQCAVEGP